MIGFEDYTGREAAIRAKLADAIAARDGIDRTSRLLHRCESEASELVTAWRRNPREPRTEIEKLCQEIVDNDRALVDDRRRRQANRNATRAQQNLRPEPDPNIVVLTIRDESIGRLVRLTLPRESVEFI